MTTTDIINRIKNRTHLKDDVKIIGEINSAKDWVSSKLFNSEAGPDVLSTRATELSIAARTREYDLGANVTGTIYGIKQLWLKLSTDVNFTLMMPADMTNPPFVVNDMYPASDVTTVAVGHPVYYEVVDFAKLRFAPPLPSGCTIRADYFRRAPDLDPVTNDALAYGDDIVQPVHEAVTDKATAQTFVNLDDDRAIYWDAKARESLSDALFLIRRRVQGPTRTQPFRRAKKRVFI